MEVEQAYKISIDSLKMATEKINVDEMKKAKEQGLIDQNDLFEFVQNKRQQEMKSSREKSQESTDFHSQKQH